MECYSSGELIPSSSVALRIISHLSSAPYKVALLWFICKCHSATCAVGHYATLRAAHAPVISNSKVNRGNSGHRANTGQRKFLWQISRCLASEPRPSLLTWSIIARGHMHKL